MSTTDEVSCRRALRVLIVEDNPADLRFVLEMFRDPAMPRCATTSAGSLAEAISQTDPDSFDVALVDLNLPDSAGLHTVAQYHARASGVASIVITGVDDERLAVAAMHAGAQDYLVKGEFSPAVLARSMRYAVERHRAAIALRKSQDRFRALFASAPIGIAVVGAGQRLLDANGVYCDLVGYSVDELRDLSVPDLMHPEDRARMEHQGEPMVGAGARGFVAEHRLMRKDRTAVHVRSSVAGVYDESGGLEYTIAMVQDMTEEVESQRSRAALEQRFRQSQKLEAIGLLAGGIAHDFNNTLNVVIGYAELTQRHLAANSRESDNLQRIIDAGRRASALVHQILLFSGRRGSDSGPLNLSDCVREASSLLRASIPSSVAIETVLSDGDCTVGVDPAQARQIVMNLCTNAAYAMRTAGGKLTLEVHARHLPLIDAVAAGCDPQREYVALTVSDTGEGMSDEVIRRLFEPFFTTKGVGHGTGMGLSVVHGIVSAAGGCIKVDSRAGFGSSFTLHLPHLREAQGPRVTMGIGDVRGGHERIMVVDDEEFLVEMLRQTFSELGYRVDGFERSEDAREAFSRNPDGYDLVITDQTMPRLSGYELACTILGRRPGLPVVICTGFSETLQLEMVRSAGVRELVLKPYEPQLMARLVRDLLDQVPGAAAVRT